MLTNTITPLKANTVAKKRNTVNRVLFITAFSVLCIYTVSMLAVYFWIMITSVKDRYDYTLKPFGLPSKLMFSNYKLALQNLFVKIKTPDGSRNVFFPELMMNTLYITFVSAFVSILVPTIVSYVTAKYNFWFNKVIHAIVIFTMVMPVSGSLASSLHIMQLTKVYDNMLLGTIIMRWTFLGSNFLFMYAAFKGIAKDYSEAAFIDGAGHFRVLFQIMIPMVANVIIMFFMLNLISWWNTWDFTMIYMPSHPNLALAVYNIQFSTDNILTGKPIQLATCVITIIPSLTIFFIFKKQIMSQVSFGGIKG